MQLTDRTGQINQIKGIGIDIVPISRMAQFRKRYDHQTLTLLFTANEIDQCQTCSQPDRCLAICFATKEAVGKALGTGLIDIDWNEIEAILTQSTITVHLHGKASTQAQSSQIHTWFADWCHWDDHVLVHVLAIELATITLIP